MPGPSAGGRNRTKRQARWAASLVSFSTSNARSLPRGELTLRTGDHFSSQVMPKFRGGGTGKLLINAMEEHVRQRKGKAGLAAQGYSSVRVHCHSQMHAEGFYAKSGYLREGEQFMEVRAAIVDLANVIRLLLTKRSAVRDRTARRTACSSRTLNSCQRTREFSMEV